MINVEDEINMLATKVWAEGTIGESLRREFLKQRIKEAIILSQNIDILGTPTRRER